VIAAFLDVIMASSGWYACGSSIPEAQYWKRTPAGMQQRRVNVVHVLYAASETG
jgi:hypothetical protein